MEQDNYLKEVHTLYDIYKKKNHDYGNSFDIQCDDFGVVAAVIRMYDKVNRLKTLCKSKAEVSESILDTVEDLANYSIMTAMWLKKEKNDNKK